MRLILVLTKAKKMPIGTVSRGRKKVAEGDWRPVKSGTGKSPGRKTEMQGALAMIGAIDRPFLEQYPTGKWGFVGRVPSSLALVHVSGRPVTAEEAAKVASHGKGLYPDIKTRVWDSAEDAISAAVEVGFDRKIIEGTMPKRGK